MPTPTEQLLSRTSYIGDGVNTDWNFSFSGGYIEQTHVKAYTQAVGGARQDLTLVPADFTGAYQLRVVPAVAVGTKLTIYRDTPKDAPLVDFVDGSNLTETALDTLARQAVFVAAESYDALNLVVGPEFQATAEQVALDAASAAVALAQTLVAAADAQSAATTAAANAAALVTPAVLAAVQPSVDAAANSATAAAASANAASVSAAGVPAAVASAVAPYLTTASTSATASTNSALSAAASATAAANSAASVASAEANVTEIADAFIGTFGFTGTDYDFGSIASTTTYLDLDLGTVP